MLYLSADTQSYVRKRIKHAFVDMQCLVMPSSDPKDRIVYPIQKLMIGSYNIDSEQLIHWSNCVLVQDNLCLQRKELIKNGNKRCFLITMQLPTGIMAGCNIFQFTGHFFGFTKIKICLCYCRDV